MLFKLGLVVVVCPHDDASLLTVYVLLRYIAPALHAHVMIWPTSLYYASVFCAVFFWLYGDSGFASSVFHTIAIVFNNKLYILPFVGWLISIYVL